MSIVGRISRALTLRLQAPRVKTGFTPLSQVRVAAVFVDADEKGVQELVSAINSYFAGKKIRAEIFALSSVRGRSEIKGAHLIGPRNVTLIGRPRHGKRHPITSIGEDLFVNLVDGSDTAFEKRVGLFTAEYCAARSKASFKVGRASGSKGIYNLFVSSEGHSAADVFAQITGVLDTVK